jgi:predicted Rossmann fold nucleotide-binding protein DprA/Smf involved in DNA uptake
VTALDETYPPALLTLDPRPATLHVVGSDEAFALRAVAIVGTRGASGYGHSVAAEIAGDLGEAGVVVVSGLALGIDGTAHRAAIESGGRTVAVLPSPLDRIYPPRHRELARRSSLVAGRSSPRSGRVAGRQAGLRAPQPRHRRAWPRRWSWSRLRIGRAPC